MKKQQKWAYRTHIQSMAGNRAETNYEFALNDFGKEGWELVAVTTVGSQWERYHFKRAIVEEGPLLVQRAKAGGSMKVSRTGRRIGTGQR